jgi:hypothetical protein
MGGAEHSARVPERSERNEWESEGLQELWSCGVLDRSCLEERNPRRAADRFRSAGSVCLLSCLARIKSKRTETCSPEKFSSLRSCIDPFHQVKQNGTAGTIGDPTNPSHRLPY